MQCHLNGPSIASLRRRSRTTLPNRMQTKTHVNGKRIIIALLLVTALAELARSSIGTCSIVEGVSMYPTFKPNDVVNSKPSRAESRRGDVVIIIDALGDRAIKRIIGLPGETVTIYRGFVYIDGKRLDEPYLAKHTYTFESDSIVMRRADWRLKDDQYFVMGDNRLESTDSRRFGPVQRGDIQGVVDLPSNSARPGFCEIIISKNGKVIPTERSREQDQTDLDGRKSNTKI